MNLSNQNIPNIIKNKKKGRIGQIIAEEDYKQHGFKIIPMKIGADFLAIKKNGVNPHHEYVEVKTGKSRLTSTQKKKRRQVRLQGKVYTVYRVTNIFLQTYLENWRPIL